VLPSAARLRTPADFAAAVRSGFRGSSTNVVVHLRPTDRPGMARAGFVVSGKVGNSVVRHRVTRKLRPLVRERLSTLPAGADLVVRALPAAAAASSPALAADLDASLAGGLRKLARAAGRAPERGPVAAAAAALASAGEGASR